MKKIIENNLTFIKYVFSAGFCFAVDLILFTIFNFIFKEKITFSILLATVLARIISSCVNYLLNKNRVFNYENNKKIDSKTILQYFCLVIIQMLVSSLTVTLIYKKTSFNESLIKIPVDCVIFLVNFFIQKNFIFNKDKKSPKAKSNLILLLYGIITSISFIVNPIMTSEQLKISIKGHALILTILSFFLYHLYKKYYNQIKRYPIFLFVSIIFSLLLIFGYSFNEVDSGLLVYGNIQVILLSIIKLFGYGIFFNVILNLSYEIINKLSFKDLKPNKLFDYLKKYPFKTSFILLFLVYGIYLIAFYPGVVGYDPSYQIKEVMGISNFYSESVNITNGNTLITQFNPILHTLLIGGLFKVGYLLGNVNFGIFLYTFIQEISFILILSYTIKFMFKEHVPEKIILAVLLIYALVPFFPFYSISAFKDTFYAMFFILFILNLYNFIKYDAKIGNIIFLVLSSLGLCFFRLNGFLTVLLSLIALVIGNKRNRKFVLLSIAIICSVYLGYKGTINYLKITPTSSREVLSVPLQQTAALIVNKEEVIEPIDRLTIAKIIDYDMVKEKYNPELSDPIKNTYNKDATTEDLKNYFSVWFKYLIKEPVIYIEATINNMYGYFYPGAQNWYFYYKKYSVLNQAGFDYHYNSLTFLRNLLTSYGFAFQYIPILNLFVNIGITAWIYLYLIAYLIIKKETKYLSILIPAILTILMCVIGPVNTYYRYVIPYSMSLPLLLSLTYINTKQKI